MTDDDDDSLTPPRQPTPRPHVLTEQQRAARREALQVKRWPKNVPVVRPEPADEITAPIELLLNGQLTPEDYAQIEALRRSEQDLHALVMNLAKALERYRREEKSGSTAVKDQVVAAVGESQRQLAELGRRIDAIAGAHSRLVSVDDLALVRAEVRAELGERPTTTKGSIHENLNRLLGTHRTARWLAGIALAAAASAATYVFAAIRNGGAEEIRLNRNERDIEQAQTELRDIRRDLRRKDP
ncbi:MAG TPA: hypothetical protein VJU58_10105 [Microbacterium sp.]|nr:hypothetical protein [Microbacterium sp.]